MGFTSNGLVALINDGLKKQASIYSHSEKASTYTDQAVREAFLNCLVKKNLHGRISGITIMKFLPLWKMCLK